MKICLIVDDYVPDSIKVTAKMMHELAIEFKNLGHEVLVVTPDSYKRLDNSSNKFENYEGIEVLRFSSGKLKNVSKVRRFISEFLLPFRAWKAGKERFKEFKMDLVVYYSPSIFWGWLVHKLKKNSSSKTYLILRDFFPQWAIDNEILSEKSLITSFLRCIEKMNYNQADTIGVMSPANLNWFNKYYKGKAKTEVLFNWITQSPLKSNEKYYRKMLKLEDKVIFFYGGNIGHAQDMSQIVYLSKNLLQYGNAHIVLVGTGDEVELVKRSIQEEKLVNLTLLDPVSQEVYKKMLTEFDVGLFCLSKCHKTHNFPGKILSYLAQGLPILGTVNPGNDLKEVIDSYEVGYVVESGKQKDFFEKAVLLLDSKVRKFCSNNSKRLLIEKFSTNRIANQILSSVKC